MSVNIYQEGQLVQIAGKSDGVVDYPQLNNKPKINNVELNGNKTLDELNIQVKGNYLTKETDPTVPSWAKQPNKPSYNKSDVGLSNVPNVTTNNQTPTFTENSSRTNIKSGETLSVIFGKISKWFTDLKTVAFSGNYNDLNNKPTIPTKVSQLTNDNGYLTKETDPTVPSWAKASSKPSYTKSEIGLSNVTNDSQVKRSEMGVKNGVATLDDSGKVLESQLPSYVDDVIEVDTYSKLPTTGESGKIYVTKDTNKTYRWSGSNYVVISETLALGVTSNTAYRGDFGNSAYQHSLKKSGNPHNVNKSDVGLGSVENKSSATIRGELTKDNVTKALGYTPPTTNTTYGVATTSELGLIKSGTDITVDGSGNVSVNDNSHSHTWENISNRPSSLPPTAHTHDDRYYTESEINTKLNGYLPKSSKAVDSDKLDGVDNTGYGRAYSSSHKFCRVGSKGTNITTAQFVEYIKTLGALNRPYWIARGSWDYAGNDKITDTGVGIIDLAGSIVEAMGNSNNYTIRITTPTTSSGGGITNAEFIYIWNGSSYKPSWRKTYNTMNKPTKSDVGLSNVPNVSTNGQTPTFSTSDSRSNINSGENLTTIFGKIRKWFADLKTVAFSGSYNDLSNKPTIPTNTSQLNNNSGFITKESDPTVPSHVKNITKADIQKWNSGGSIKWKGEN